jgi:hypothetical protein
VAQTSGTKRLQNGDFVVELVLRPHKPNRFASHDRQIERCASCPPLRGASAFAAMNAIRMKPAPIPIRNQAPKSPSRMPSPTPTTIAPTKAGPPYA